MGLLSNAIDKINAKKGQGNQSSSNLAGDEYYEKAGYQGSLLYNPHTNIIRYGDYEFFADQVGVTQQPPAVKQNTPEQTLSSIATGKTDPASKLYPSQPSAKNSLADYAPPPPKPVIPDTIEFVNMLNAKANQIANAAKMGQVTDPTRPNPKNSRLQKANLSRAGTVLTEGALAGSPSTLGASTTALGS